MCYHECTLFKQIFKRICEGDDEQSVLPGQITCSKMEVIFLRLFICGGNTTSVKDHYKSARQFGPFLEEVFETNLSGNNSWIPAEGQHGPGNNSGSLFSLSHNDMPQEAMDSRAVKHVVYWKLNNAPSSAEDGAASPTKSSQPFKVHENYFQSKKLVNKFQ